MVQPSFSSGSRAIAAAASPTAPLDEFLDNQHQSYFEELYRSEAACLCILRLLPPVSRQIILQVLWSYLPLKSTEVKAMCQMDFHDSLSAVEEVLRPAIDRKIFGTLQHVKNHMQTPMNAAFKSGLRNALTGLGTSNSFGVPHDRTPGDPAPTVDDLVSYGDTTWESILRYMVSSGLGSGIASVRPRNQVLQLLCRSGLMADPADLTGENPSIEHLTITSKGFQFLLEDRQTQLWQILMYYLASKQDDQQKSAEILSMFFSLGCMTLGQDYSASQSFPHAQRALADLENYGFIYRRSKDTTGKRADQFFPTHLATSLTSGDAAMSTSQSVDEKRFLILETNYKIYAYTENELEIAILNLFVDIKIRYKNMVVGKLDRKNVKAAMEKGISANQIIAYLASHAHPQMYNSPPPLLHPTITDQLHLWDKERNRLKTEDTLCFEFFNNELFENAEAEARRYDGLLLSVPSQRILFIDPSIKDAIKDFVMGQQKQLRAGI